MTTVTNNAIEAWSNLTEKEQFYAIGVLACDAPELLERAAELARERTRALGI